MNGCMGGESGTGLVEITVTQQVDEDLVFVDVAGELDIFTAGDVRNVLAELIDRGHVEVAVDLRRVAFMDSTGLAVLIGAWKMARADRGSVTVVCADGQPLRVLEQTGLHKIFSVYPSREAALARAE